MYVPGHHIKCISYCKSQSKSTKSPPSGPLGAPGALPSPFTLIHPWLPLPLEVAFEKNLKHAWEWVWYMKRDREKEFWRDTFFPLLFSLRARLPSLAPARAGGCGDPEKRRAEKDGGGQAGTPPGVPLRTGLDFRAQAKGCSLLESSAEQMFPYLPCY